jgi:hypothetical protein
MQKTGWDLFEAGRCIAGGVLKNPETGLSAPLLPTLEAAQSWFATQWPARSGTEAVVYGC